MRQRPGLSATLLRRAKPVRLLVLDVDGVFTDNTVFLDGHSPGIKRFGIQDGMGLKVFQAAGMEVAFLSGLDNDSARARARDLGIGEFHGGHLKKLPVYERLLADKGLDPSQTAYMGDDWLDAPVLARAGLAMTVADAQPEIRRLAHWVSKSPGGHGAVREAVRFLLLAQGRLDALWRHWRD